MAETEDVPEQCLSRYDYVFKPDLLRYGTLADWSRSIPMVRGRLTVVVLQINSKAPIYSIDIAYPSF